MNTKRLTTLAMMIAIYIVLSILTPIRIINFKFTFEAFPILVAGLLMGPIDGMITGAVGSFIYQLFFSGYGITPTTILWIPRVRFIRPPGSRKALPKTCRSLFPPKIP